MLFVDVKDYDSHFQSNLADWCMGGPKPCGWTRTGLAITLPKIKLGKYVRRTISVDEALAKNFAEVMKWHVAFLQNEEPPENTLYYKEYLVPRYWYSSGEDKIKRKINTFFQIYDRILEHGFEQRSPVHVADVSWLNLGFKYFRFDGTHRLAAAKVIGLASVPACVFTTVADQ